MSCDHNCVTSDLSPAANNPNMIVDGFCCEFGGGWCPVANPSCETREERQVMITKCDSFTPVTGDCEELFCGCNAHT